MDKPINDEGVAFHAGFPNPAGDDASRRKLSLDRLLTHNNASTFYMQIEGDAWHSLGIFADDIAVIDRSLVAHKHDIVVYWDDISFSLTKRTKLPADKQPWGVITATVHRFRS